MTSLAPKPIRSALIWTALLSLFLAGGVAVAQTASDPVDQSYPPPGESRNIARSLSVSVAPSDLYAAPGETATTTVIVRNTGDSPTHAFLSAHVADEALSADLDRRLAYLEPGASVTTTLRVEIPAETGRGVHRIEVRAAMDDANGWYYLATAWLEVGGVPCCAQPEPRPPCCPTPADPPTVVEPCCPPTWGHATPSGFRVFVPLQPGQFTLPIFVRGEVVGETLVLDVDFAQGAAGPR